MMKKVLNYIFKDWKISDYIVCALAVAVSIALLIVSKCIKKPVEVARIFSTAHVVCAILLVWSVVFCSKKTIHGYVLGLGSIAFFSYYLFKGDCFGSFIGAMFIEAYLLFKLVLLCLKKEINFDKFGLWDYVCLFGGLAICAFPLFMIMDTLFASFLITEILAPLFVLATLYLAIKNVKFSKLTILGALIVTAVTLVMLVVQLKLEFAGLILGLLVLIAFEVIEGMKLLLNIKKIKQD